LDREIELLKERLLANDKTWASSREELTHTVTKVIYKINGNNLTVGPLGAFFSVISIFFYFLSGVNILPQRRDVMV